MPVFSQLAETTWGFPIMAAMHVMGLAWFGGTVIVPGEFPRLQRWGLAFMLFTGTVLFLIQPERYSHSAGFWLKLALLATVLLWRRAGRWTSLALWFAVICAARAVAFF